MPYSSKQQRRISLLFDRVFKCLLSLSDTAVISFINGLFNASYPRSASLSRPSPESIQPSLRSSLADMVIAINGDSYLIEAQISNDSSMAVRIFQYIMNEGRKQGGAGEGGGVRIRLPRARVIYWEDTAGTPEQEYIEFVFPGGEKHLYEIPSVKFSRYGVRELEEEGLGLLLPFCVVKGRRGLKRAKEEERKEAAKEAEDAAREAVEAMGRLRGRGELNGYDMENMMMLTKVLWEELYRPYTEFAMEEGKMWEHIKLLDYDAVIRERDEAKRRADEATWQRDEAKRRADEAARKLLAMGVSREQLENVGLLE